MTQPTPPSVTNPTQPVTSTPVVPTPPGDNMKSKRIYAIWHAAFAGATIIIASSQLGELVGQREAGIIGMTIGALQISVISYYALMGKPVPAP